MPVQLGNDLASPGSLMGTFDFKSSKRCHGRRETCVDEQVAASIDRDCHLFVDQLTLIGGLLDHMNDLTWFGPLTKPIDWLMD